MKRGEDSGFTAMAAGWQTKRLLDLPVEIIDGDRSSKYPKRSEFLPTGVPFLSSSIIVDNRLVFEDANFISDEKFSQISKGRVQRKDIIVTTRGNGVGKAAYFFGGFSEALINAQMLILRANAAAIDPRFLFFQIISPHFQAKIRGHASGSAQPQIPIRDFREIEVVVPPLSVQRRISGILSAYDDLMENSQRRIRLLEAMARALYREWFVHFRFPLLRSDGSYARQAGHEKHPRVASPLGDIPQGWEVKPVESFCPLVSRGVTPKYEIGSGRFIINQKVNRGSELSLDDLKELEPSLEVPADKFARFGDVLVNCLGEGTIGRVHFYAEPHQEWAVDQHMSICRAARSSDSLYVYFALESPEGQGRITSLKTGGTNMTMFNISALRSFAVVAPPAKLVARFAELALPMMRQKQALTELNRNFRRTRDLLLPRLLSGQVELKTEEVTA